MKLLKKLNANFDVKDRWGKTPKDEAENKPEILQLISWTYLKSKM